LSNGGGMSTKLSTRFKLLAERVWVVLARIRLILSGSRKLSKALDGRDFPLRNRIEEARRQFHADNSPLADGSLGPAGVYDEGQTIADACDVSKKAASARRLRSIAAEYKLATILELGTNIGLSSAYLASSGGKVTTLESSPYRIRIAQNLHRSLGLQVETVQGLFSETLIGTLDRLGTVDMAFIDGHHQFQPTLDYFEAILAHTRKGSIIVFDDIRWSKGMKRAWKLLRKRPEFGEVADLGGVGVGIIA
jgi:predicted O-methyltransferase YrrM